MKIVTNNVKETQKIGQKIGQIIKNISLNLDTALVISLEGDLGGGKTSFMQGFARGLSLDQKILSPTFIICRQYELSESSFESLYHCDYYRLDQEENKEVGFDSFFSNPKNLVVVEWGNKIKPMIPEQSLTIKFDFKEKEKRVITIIDSFKIIDSLNNESIKS